MTTQDQENAVSPASSPDGLITADQIGAGDDTVYGADVAPTAPVQPMWQYDAIGGRLPAPDRDASPASFTGGAGGGGLGGNAEPMSGGGELGGTVYQRRGF
ncbi:MAG: hypothetical protein ACRDFX_12460 [Chloroflexota bacterium]